MLAWLGGSFNPIHQGHVQLAIEAKDILPLQEVSLLPCAQHPLKKNVIPSENEKRLHKIKQIIKAYPFLTLDDTELNSQQPVNYTVDTLAHLSHTYPNHTLIFILGSDALIELNRWKNWQELLRYNNLLIFNRIHQQKNREVIPPEVLKWLKQHRTSLQHFVSLYQTNKTPIHGKILHRNMRQPVEISSTQLRQQSTSLV